MTTPDPDAMLSVAEVAALAGVAPATIRAYAHRGQMPAPAGRVGRAPYWQAATVWAWVESRGPNV